MVGNVRNYLALSLITKKPTDNNRAAHKFYHGVWDDKRNKSISCNPRPFLQVLLSRCNSLGVPGFPAAAVK